MKPTREGGPCRWCGCTTRYVHSRKCINAGRSDHLSENSRGKRRASWRAYYHRNRDERVESQRQYRESNRDYWRRYYKAHPAKFREARARRRASLRNATPPWVDREAIRAIYDACPPGHHVDHIVPLAGRDVCGLHVPWNLQYLPAAENLAKGARFTAQLTKELNPMAFTRTRKMVFQNASSGKIYEVIFSRASNGAISGVGRLLGTNQINSDPVLDNTEVSFVVLTTQLSKVMGSSAQHDSALAQGAYFHASNPGGTGAALSTLLT